MAHECPECGCTCYCHGDIDDCIFNDTHEETVCDHCPDEFMDEGEEDSGIYPPEEEPRQ